VRSRLALTSALGLVLWAAPASGAVAEAPHAVVRSHTTALRVTRGSIRWRRVLHARYYEVVLWRAHGRVADVWTTRHLLTVSGLRQALGPKTLAPGRYLWFVYPGFGSRSAHRYGHLSAQGILSLHG
jgi:hypothetical protein